MKTLFITLFTVLFLPTATFAMDHGHAVESMEKSVAEEAQASSAVTEVTEESAEDAATELEQAVEVEKE